MCEGEGGGEEGVFVGCLASVSVPLCDRNQYVNIWIQANINVRIQAKFSPLNINQ